MPITKQKTLGELIQNLRESENISQEVLAEHLDITRQAVGQIEKGARRVDSLELAKIAEFFSVSVDHILSSTAHTKKQSKQLPVEKREFQPEKLENLLLYMLEKCGGKPNIGETVLYKLLYFVDFDAFETFGAPVTGMSYIKLQYGPVPAKKEYDPVLSSMKECGKLNIFTHKYFNKMQKRYVALANPNLKCFTAIEIELISKVINKLSNMSANEITEFVHEDVPWKLTKENDIIDYRLAFDRETPYSSNDYDLLMQDAGGRDILDSLGPISEEEEEYYRNL